MYYVFPFILYIAIRTINLAYKNYKQTYLMKKLILLFIVLISASCTTENTVRYTVASETVDCTGVGPQKCLQVKIGDSDNWQYFYSQIEGFNYEEGYEYVLDVKEEEKEHTPADASSIRYILVKEISKIKK